MKLPALLLAALLFSQSLGFEFVIDGEWEDESDHDDLLRESPRYRRNVLISEEEEDFEAIQGDNIKVKTYKVESRITSRFAHTTVSSSVENVGTNAESIGFNVQIPKQAFINNFTMNVNGITFVGSVKEKTVARNLYAQARARGKAAGIVRTNSQSTETFKTEVHVPPGSKVVFELHYQEMMQRKLGSYTHTLHIQPGRLVPLLQVDVYIFESKGIKFVEVPDTLGEHFKELVKITHTNQKAHVVFRPTIQQQRKCSSCSDTAVDGVLTVRYDVERENNGPELLVSNGHFVNFFAPSLFSPLSKNIVFVIDVSGSMWGLKMKQTVEAMKTILDDLTEDDYFSIIDFNHNVRCWSEDLLMGSSLNLKEAKKYIQDIKPNGGTNINEALLKAIQMLLKAQNQGLIDPRSVSMIILISDGDPTVGEIKLSTIQKNIKRAMHKDFSLFSLGIGFDVDFDFLERIAMENRGMAQRIFANHDASDQLKMFYSQVSSPLLKQITISFEEGSVTNVTQNQFDKFFKGSELVVAGKINPSDSNKLQGIITASAAAIDVTIEAEADVQALDALLNQQQHSFADFARQMWAYITVNQLLAERSVAATAAKKRRITQRLLTLSLEHQFVTPVTSLLVESEAGPERLLADSPRDPRHGCCSVTPSQTVRMVESLPPKIPPWAVAPPTPGPYQAEVLRDKQVTMLNVPTSVDNDPHFIVHLHKNNMDVCFNIDSKPGHILNLVSDPVTGIAINGQLISGKKMKNNKLNTYFGTISIYAKELGLNVVVHTNRIDLIEGKNNHSFSWGATTYLNLKRAMVSIQKENMLTVTIDGKISVRVLLHRVWKKHPFNVDFLGIYTIGTNQYSSQVHGLIGQFSSEPNVKVYDLHEGTEPEKKQATMEVKGNKLTVTRGKQKDYQWNRKQGSDVYCWFVHNSGKGFIDGHYTSYIVPSLDSFLPPV
ncbi:inter-alpha-trypsin inhibitor heavy chain H2 [Clarias gariepinus]|uniref:inter-alpha-trypsin inhibitor heavy chain H2-like n=1 Tax=Clarias gariepinus TaxID=13013 RepID=UPI00234E1AE7|nr:inter-alpha-trypsin inhibitor heavy chain H2-like [Clarias gariepinus]